MCRFDGCYNNPRAKRALNERVKDDSPDISHQMEQPANLVFLFVWLTGFYEYVSHRDKPSSIYNLRNSKINTQCRAKRRNIQPSLCNKAHIANGLGLLQGVTLESEFSARPQAPDIFVTLTIICRNSSILFHKYKLYDNVNWNLVET